MADVFRTALGLLAISVFIVGCDSGSNFNGGDGTDGDTPDLSGTIAIETNTRIDLDTADDIRLDPSVSNNRPESAQALPANATVGGYLSANAAFYSGSASGFEYFRDTVDYYTANLVAGDRISLQVFASPSSFLATHPEPPTRQVKVLRPDGSTLASDSTSGNLDPLIVTLPQNSESRSYLIEVSTSGNGMPFRYVLSLAGFTDVTGVNARYSEPSFLVDQAIVQMKPRAGNQAMASGIATSMGVTTQRHLGRDTWLVERGSTRARILSGQVAPDERKATLDWVRSLAKQPGVRLAEPNYVYTAQAVSPNDDDLYKRQWGLPFIQAPLAWSVAPRVGEGIGIAILDTGVFRSPPTSTGEWHPDLKANIRLIPGEIMDYVSGSLDIDQDDGRDTNPADPGDGKDQSSNFHGTHVAGIAAAADNTIGVVGVAPEALIYPVRVLGKEGIGSSADLIAAIQWAATRPEIDVLNLSLGGLGQSEALKTAIDLAWNEGKLIVAAAGNAATDEATYPAAYDNVVGVGAVDGDGVRAGYSNTGPNVDVVAPGGDASRDANQDGFPDVIVSTWGTDENNNFVSDYFALQGTSMAAPHIAGVYGLMKAEVADLTPVKFMAYLKAGDLTRPAGSAFEYGAGIIDALAAMDAALEGNLPVTLSSSPTALQFNAAVLEGELSLTTFPDGEEVTVESATSSAGWLSATVDQPVSSSSSATVTVTVDPSTLDSRKRYGTEVVVAYRTQSNEPKTLSVPVSLQLGSTPEDKNAGRHYVLLISSSDDENDGEVIEQAVVTVENGRYEFAFDTVEPGDYFLVAGTDTDNNGFICENGEACAEYPVNGLPETISLGEIPQSGVVLNTSFRRPAISALGGLPRIGFGGYRVKSEADKSPSEPLKEYAR